MAITTTDSTIQSPDVRTRPVRWDAFLIQHGVPGQYRPGSIPAGTRSVGIVATSCQRYPYIDVRQQTPYTEFRSVVPLFMRLSHRSYTTSSNRVRFPGIYWYSRRPSPTTSQRGHHHSALDSRANPTVRYQFSKVTCFCNKMEYTRATENGPV